VSAIEKIKESIKKLTVVELSDLVKQLEEEFGVTAAVPVFAAGVSAAATSGEAAVEEEEKTEFNVVLTSFGERKIQVIKVVRASTGLGLKEAKELVDGVPNTVKEALSKEEAEKLKSDLEEAGAVVELK